MTDPLDRDLSVVIPTRNRVGALRRCLEALSRQTLPSERFEVVVADNGSGEAALDAARQAAEAAPCRTQVVVETRPGPAAARNRGIDASRGRQILFLGDDILASPDLLAEHLAAAGRHPDCAILGFTDWAPTLRLTPFMRYLAPERGPQFRYATIGDPENCGYAFFYTSNISLPRRWLDIERFDEAFPYACFEDADLGYRLEKRGLQIVFHKPALAHHDHAIRFGDFVRRMKIAGEMNLLFYNKYPELHEDYNIIPSEGHRRQMGRRRRRVEAWLLTRLIAVTDPLGIPWGERVYRRVLEYYFVRSFTTALQEQNHKK